VTLEDKYRRISTIRIMTLTGTGPSTLYVNWIVMDDSLANLRNAQLQGPEISW
jgi:hypothetical protein